MSNNEFHAKRGLRINNTQIITGITNESILVDDNQSIVTEAQIKSNLDTKLSATPFNSHTGNTSNPHQVTLGQLSGVSHTQLSAAPDPTTLNEGDEWWDIDTLRLYKVYDNGGTFIWVQSGDEGILPVQTLTDAATITWDNDDGRDAKVTLTANRIMGNISNVVEGQVYTIWIIQDTTGTRLITWSSNYKFSGGVPITLSAGPGVVDKITFKAISSTELHFQNLNCDMQ